MEIHVRGLDDRGTDAPLQTVALVTTRTWSHAEAHDGGLLVVVNQVHSLPELRALDQGAPCYKNNPYYWEVHRERKRERDK
jgi:hypothetical protein